MLTIGKEGRDRIACSFNFYWHPTDAIRREFKKVTGEIPYDM